MKAIIKGHQYELKNLEDPKVTQTISFIQKVPATPAPESELETKMDGTTNEEVIAMLIDRMKYLNAQMPCRENGYAITLLEKAQSWLIKRTNDRKKRKVKGTRKA